MAKRLHFQLVGGISYETTVEDENEIELIREWIREKGSVSLRVVDQNGEEYFIMRTQVVYMRIREVHENPVDSYFDADGTTYAAHKDGRLFKRDLCPELWNLVAEAGEWELVKQDGKPHVVISKGTGKGSPE